MGNIKASSREQDVRLYCGAIIRNIRNKKEFSFQTLYEETCKKKNPNKAYRLRDALLATKYIIKHSDGSYSLKHENNDSDKIVADVMEYMKNHPIRSKKDEAPKEESQKPDLLEGVEISPNPQRMEDDVLDGSQSFVEHSYLIEGPSRILLRARRHISKEQHDELVNLGLRNYKETIFIAEKDFVKCIHIVCVDGIME